MRVAVHALLPSPSQQWLHSQLNFVLAGIPVISPCYVICSPAQFAEETRWADRMVPRGIVFSALLNFTFGLGYIVVILFCLPVRLRPSKSVPLCYLCQTVGLRVHCTCSLGAQPYLGCWGRC